MNGILNINKPAEMTSFDVVARVKRITGEKRTGHAGTLDPLAKGVLPVCLGQATRIIEYLFNETKNYRSEVELGVTTDTYDSTGKVLKTCDPSGITREMVESALTGFRGQIQQVPPMYSALKHNGKPLYELARSGIEVERKSRPARIDSLEITAWQPPVVTLDIVCGKGTYIRSIANDLGEALGCGAVMKSLVRLRVGPFTIEEALTLEQLEESCRRGDIEKYLYPADYALLAFNALVVNHEQQCSLIHGSPVEIDISPRVPDSQMPYRVYTSGGDFLGMVKYVPENHYWQPEKIFLTSCCQQGAPTRD
jgi:tRNA pseudouridine55 synthase